MLTPTDLEREFGKVAEARFSDVFRTYVKTSDDLFVGRGLNDVRPARMRKPVGIVLAGVRDADLSNPYDLYEVVQSFFHELEHMKHHAEAYRGKGFEGDMSYLTVEYLACASDPIRYKRTYEHTAFETEAHRGSVLPAIELCSKLMPGVDFEKVAVDVWHERCRNASVPFVEDWERCNTVEKLLDGMARHVEACKSAPAMRPDVGVDFLGEVRTDGSLTYLKEHASVRFCELWANAETNARRNYLAAAAFAEANPADAKRICPGVRDIDLFVRGVDVTREVRGSMRNVASNTELDFWSEHDMVGDLRTRLALGRLEVRTPNDVGGDRLSLGEYGLTIRHTGPDYVGERIEHLSFAEDEPGVLRRVLHEMATGHLDVIRGDVSDVFSRCLDVVRKVEAEEARDLSPIPEQGSRGSFASEVVFGPSR